MRKSFTEEQEKEFKSRLKANDNNEVLAMISLLQDIHGTEVVGSNPHKEPIIGCNVSSYCGED